MPATGLGNSIRKQRYWRIYLYRPPPDYHRAINTVSVTYSWETKKKILVYSLTPINLNVIRSTTSDKFNALLDTLRQHGNNLVNSFKPSFVSSMLFSVTWNPNNYGNTKTSAFFLRRRWRVEALYLIFILPRMPRTKGWQSISICALCWK